MAQVSATDFGRHGPWETDLERAPAAHFRPLMQAPKILELWAVAGLPATISYQAIQISSFSSIIARKSSLLVDMASDYSNMLPPPVQATKEEYVQDKQATGWSSSALWTYIMEEVDPSRSTLPLSAYCFMTGFMCVSLLHIMLIGCSPGIDSDSISFSAIFVWCGFQTGNTVQVCEHRLLSSLRADSHHSL